MVEQRQQRVPVVLHVGQDNRLIVAPELRPGADLDQLLEGSHAPRQGDETVGVREHAHLALVHVGGDDELIDVGEHAFLVDEEFRYDSGHMAAGGKRRLGELAHEPEAAAAVNESDAAVGQQLAERARCRGIGRIASRARTAINTKMPYGGHMPHLG